MGQFGAYGPPWPIGGLAQFHYLLFFYDKHYCEIIVMTPVFVATKSRCKNVYFCASKHPTT